MKRTLRVLFLAVLAMALMASGAFAAGITADSFDVKITLGAPYASVEDATVTSGIPYKVSADAASIVVTFKFADTVNSKDSYDFAYTAPTTTGFTASMYIVKSKDTSIAASTKVSGDKPLTLSIDVAETAKVLLASATSVDLTFTFDVTSSGKSVAKFPVVIKLVSTDNSGGGNSGGDKPTIEFLNLTDARSFTLYMSGDVAAKNGSKSFDVVVLISGDDEGLYGDPVLVISEDEDAEESYTTYFEVSDLVENENYTGEGTAYTVTLTPVSLDTTGTDYTFYIALVSDDEDATEVAKTDTATMTVAILDSSDGKATSTWELKVTPSETSVELSYYQEKDVTLTIEPAGVTPTVTFDAVTGLTITEKTSAAATTAAANTKTYTIKAGKTSGDFEVVFNVSATSGDTQTASADVAVTVEFEDVEPAEPTLMTKAEFLKQFPKYEGKWWIDFLLSDPTELKNAFKNQPIVVWVMKAAGPVKRSPNKGEANGWKLYFLKPAGGEYSSRFYVQQWIGALLDLGEVSVADAATTTSNDLVIDPVSDDTAIYFTNVDNMKPVLDKGDNDVRCSYVLEAYEDEGSDTEATPNTVGAIAGEKEEELEDRILGGSSGGCDAGFGAMALALAATLFLGKKRS